MTTPSKPTKAERTAVDEIERMRNLLAFLLVGAFISCLPVFCFREIPIGNKDIVTYMVGQLSGMALTALGFYFVNKVGADAVEAKRLDVDAKRAENTGKMADAITATAGAAKPVDDKAIEDMSLEELVAAATREGVLIPDPAEEAALRKAILAKRADATGA